MNLVVGSTGVLGMEIVREFAAQGKPVRALVRPSADAHKVEALRQMGAEIAQGDVQDRASLDAACRGATGVITTLSTTFSRQPSDSIQTSDLEGQKSLVDAAKAAGVKHFVYVSMTGNAPKQMAFVQIRRQVEEYVRNSGLPYTILRPAAFMDTYLNPLVGFDIANGRVSVFGAGTGKHNWIAARDIAKIAVGALDNPYARNKTLELGGPEWSSTMDVIRLCEGLTGKAFTVQHIPEAALEAQIAAATSEYQKVFPQFGLWLVIPGEPGPTDMRDILAAFPGLRLMTVREYVSQFVPQ